VALVVGGSRGERRLLEETNVPVSSSAPDCSILMRWNARKDFVYRNGAIQLEYNLKNSRKASSAVHQNDVTSSKKME
jgi:hypothetical protein